MSDPQTSTALTVIERAAVALGATELEKTLLELSTQSREITVITNPAGYQQCHAARMRLKSERVALEKRGKDARDDATKFAKAVIEKERQLVALIEPEEKRLQVIQDAWDTAREAERQAKIRAEQERLARIQAAIECLKAPVIDCAGQPSAVIAHALERTKAEPIDQQTYGEFQDVAEQTKVATVKKLTELHAAAVAQEQEAERQRIEAERLRQEREELARLRAEQEKREQEERARVEAENKRRAEEEAAARRKIEEEQRAARLRIEEQERQARLQREEADRQARLAREAEEAKLKEERDRLAAQQREIEERERRQREEEEARAAAERRAQEEAERQEREEAEAKARAEREAEDARQREIQRQQNELLDAREMLATFKQRFGHIAEFARIVKAIDTCLKPEAKKAA